MNGWQRHSIGLLALSSVVDVATAQTVHVLSGGSGSALQAAIDVALDGDTILLHGGSFVGVHVGDRALSIVSEPEQSTTIRALDVTGLSAGKRVVLSGLRLVTDDAAPLLARPNPPRAALTLTDCGGSVRVQNVHCLPFVAQSGAHAAVVTNCPDVAFLHSEVIGGDRPPANGFFTSGYWGPGIGLWTKGTSQVALYDSTVHGGNGSNGLYVFIALVPQLRDASAGAPALQVDAGTVFVGHSLLHGGDGGRGSNAGCSQGCGLGASDGAVGGDGLAAASGAQVFTADSTLSGGTGGLGGSGVTCSGGSCSGTVVHPPGSAAVDGVASSGAVNALAGALATLSATPLVREFGSITIDASGTPGDIVTLAISQGTPWILAPSFQGVFLYGPGVRRFTLGMIPGSGVLSTSLPFGPLPAGVESSTRYLQLFVRDPSNATHLGSAAVVKVVGQAF